MPGGNATGNCAPAGSDVTKVENPGDEYTFPVPEGTTVTSVFVKAGKACFELTAADPTEGCYTASGFGTDEVTVTRTGSGPQCKAISHLEFVLGTAPAEPTTTTTEATTTTTGKPTTTTTSTPPKKP